jgi:hypothetical protein
MHIFKNKILTKTFRIKLRKRKKVHAFSKRFMHIECFDQKVKKRKITIMRSHLLKRGKCACVCVGYKMEYTFERVLKWRWGGGGRPRESASCFNASKSFIGLAKHD